MALTGDNLEKQRILDELKRLYPTARPRFIEICLDLIELHNNKNNDYNGDMELYRATGIFGRFCDVWRKVIRLFNSIVKKNELLVDEKLIETTLDLSVYSILLAEELEEEK